MKNFFIVLSAVFVLAACQDKKEKPLPANKYEVTGKIDGLSEDMRLIVSDISTKDIVPLYEVKVKKNDNFLFRGDLDKTMPYYLTLVRESDSTFSPADNLVVFFEPTRINIEAKADKLAEAKITGSRAHSHFDIYRTQIAPYEKQMATINQKSMQSAVQKDTTAYRTIMRDYDKIYNEWVSFNKKFLLEDSLDYSVRSFLAVNYMLDEEYLKELQQFVKSENTTVWSKHLLSFIKQVENVAVGTTAPEITSLVNPKLEATAWTSLEEKPTVVYFWTSFNPKAVLGIQQLTLLDKSLDKNSYNYVGISLDTDEKVWQQAIKNLPTSHRQYLDNSPNQEVALAYHITDYPLFIVLDAQKNILYKTNSVEKLNSFLVK